MQRHIMTIHSYKEEMNIILLYLRSQGNLDKYRTKKDTYGLPEMVAFIIRIRHSGDIFTYLFSCTTVNIQTCTIGL